MKTEDTVTEIHEIIYILCANILLSGICKKPTYQFAVKL